MDSAQSPSARRTLALGSAALERLWARLGLAPETPVVLSNRGSLLLRMRATGLVARVPTHTGWQRLQPGWWLQNEIATGRFAQAAGVPAALPAGEVDPGPHEVDGLWISLWQDLGDDTSRATPAEAAQALATWHNALADQGAGMPVMPMITQGVNEPLDYAARQGHLDAATHAALTREHERALAAVDSLGSQEVLLHGDAHRGNLHRDTSGTWRWIDLEESCRGPLEWDLAVLGASQEGEATLAAYCEITGRDVPTHDHLAPWARLRRLEAAAWMLGCAVTFPERYAEQARMLVDDILAERS